MSAKLRRKPWKPFPNHTTFLSLFLLITFLVYKTRQSCKLFKVTHVLTKSSFLYCFHKFSNSDLYMNTHHTGTSIFSPRSGIIDSKSNGRVVHNRFLNEFQRSLLSCSESLGWKKSKMVKLWESECTTMVEKNSEVSLVILLVISSESLVMDLIV